MCSMAGIREARSVTCCEIHAGLWTGPWALTGTTFIGELRSFCWQVQLPWNRTGFPANLEQQFPYANQRTRNFAENSLDHCVGSACVLFSVLSPASACFQNPLSFRVPTIPHL